MSAEDLEKYETEMELTLYREYRDVVGIFKYVVETDRRFYLCNQVDVKARTEAGDVFFEVSMSDAWVWDMYRPARFAKNVKVLTFKDVTPLLHDRRCRELRAPPTRLRARARPTRAPNRTARDLLPRSMTADRTRHGNSLPRLSRGHFPEVVPNCSIFVTVLRASIRQACYRAPLVTDGRTSLRVLRRQVALSALLDRPALGRPCSGSPHPARAPIRSARSARRRRPCSGSCSSSTRPRSGRTAATRRRTTSCGSSSTSSGSITQALGVARGNLGRAQHALAKRLVADLHDAGSAVVARRHPRRPQPQRPHLAHRGRRLDVEAGHGAHPARWSGSSTRSCTGGRCCAPSAPGSTGWSPSRAAERTRSEGRVASERHLYSSVQSQIRR